MANDNERERFYSVAPSDTGELQRLRDEIAKLKEQLDVYTHREKMNDDTNRRPIREPIRAITYEITQWVLIKFQPARYGHGERWYITTHIGKGIGGIDYLSEDGTWQMSHPKFFESPEDAANFWYETADKRI